MAGIGASSSLPDTPAKVPSPNPQPPHALGSGDRAVIATGEFRGPRVRLLRVFRCIDDDQKHTLSESSRVPNA
jgi:hypothetical protein